MAAYELFRHLEFIGRLRAEVRLWRWRRRRLLLVPVSHLRPLLRENV